MKFKPQQCYKLIKTLLQTENEGKLGFELWPRFADFARFFCAFALKYLVDNINDATRGLFESHKVDGIKYFIKRFLRGQERGKLQDISNLMLPKYNFIYINYEIEFGDNPIYVEFYDLIKKLYDKIKIEYVFSDYYGGGYCV